MMTITDETLNKILWECGADTQGRPIPEQIRKIILTSIEVGLQALQDDYFEVPDTYPDCPVCLRKTAQTYAANLTAQAVTAYSEVAELTSAKGLPWIKLAQYGGRYVLPDGTEQDSKIKEARKRIQEGVWFRVIERVAPNCYRITDQGLEFLAGAVLLPSYLRIRNGRAEERSKEWLSVHEVEDVDMTYPSQVRRMRYPGKDINVVKGDLDVPEELAVALAGPTSDPPKAAPRNDLEVLMGIGGGFKLPG